VIGESRFELERAITQNELELHYQPIFDISGDALRGVEALVRWKHPQRGLVSPHAFLPTAAREGLMHALTAWVLREALLQASVWRKDGLTLNISVTLHNVSAVGMVLVFSLVVFWVRAALPEAPVAFFVLGYVFFATIVAVLLFFVVGYYVLTATELVAGVVVFAWLIVYLRVSGAVGRRSSAGRLEGPPLASAAGRAHRSE